MKQSPETLPGSASFVALLHGSFGDLRKEPGIE